MTGLVGVSAQRSGGIERVTGAYQYLVISGCPASARQARHP